MSEGYKYYICLKCGKYNPTQSKFPVCSFCESEDLLQLDEKDVNEARANIPNGTYANDILDARDEILREKFVYGNPKFDKVLYNRRANKNKEMWEDARKQRDEDLNTVHCPRCGSTNITAVTRKWSPFAGILTNKVDRICLNCKCRF